MARRWQVLLVTAVAVFMSFLDVTIVNIAFPDIRASFPGSSLNQLSWILNAYSIVFAAALVPAGRLADRFGRRRFFFLGTFVFLAASAVCGAAGSVDVLIGARTMQALGGAMLVPASLGLLLPEFPLERRATATALWGATGAAAAAAGPSLGGLLVDWQSWRAVFFVNLLIGLPALLPARRLLRERREPRTRFPDALGAIMLAGGVGALALAIVQGPQWRWGSARVVAAFAASAALLAAFVWRSARHRAPVIELSLFRVRSFTVANAGGFVFALGFYALLLCNVLFLTGVWHYSILRAGVALTPGPLMAALAAPIGGRLSDRFGQRVVAVPGSLLFAAGCLLFALRTGAHSSYAADFLPANMLGGTGIGLTFAAFGSAAVAELPRSRYATGGAINNCIRQIGAVLGISTLIVLLGTPTPANALPLFHRAWALMALTGAIAAVTALALGRVRASHPGEETFASTSTITPLAAAPRTP
ncbi:MAG TPA: DHA2 family efflux MFS transporter permease subunit [Thermoanaerobaculia bacterium]|nr:DHA2 family efflux MFS transporter permease subunit [Thermoanaerobaculia bacterium]